jgi:hypothetical protein
MSDKEKEIKIKDVARVGQRESAGGKMLDDFWNEHFINNNENNNQSNIHNKKKTE